MNGFPVRYLAAFFTAAVIFLTYLWWGIAEHLTYLILNVDAYSHGQLVPFISLWLIWNKRESLTASEAFIWFPGLLLLGAASFLWLISEIGEVKLFGHIAYVTGIQALILTFFGPNVYQRLLFPCFFLYMGIPIGEGLVPHLQDITAHFSVVLLAIVGIPYTLDGFLITLPSGVYEVAQACAGVRFLFTSLVTGVLLAHLLYTGWQKRLSIIMASIVIPVFANVLRVFGIFLISEATDQSFAREVDHIVYGWLFLSAVLLSLIAVAYKFADEEGGLCEAGIWFIFTNKFSAYTSLITVVVAFVTPFIVTQFEPRKSFILRTVTGVVAPECDDCGIRLVPELNRYDRAIFIGEDAKIVANYRIAADQIEVSSALYCPQRSGSDLLQTGNLPRGTGWRRYDSMVRSVHNVAGIPFTEIVYSKGPRRKYVWISYYVDGAWIATPDKVRWASAKERLYKGVSAGAMLVVSSQAYSNIDNPRATLTKLFSTFSPENFLWEEIKPSQEGTILCAE